MLQTIRDKAQGWFAWMVVILISVPFALWGIQEYLNVGGEPVAAKVNGVSITERDLDQQVRKFREDMRSRLGKAFNEELFTETLLRRQVLDSMINDHAVLQATESMGLRAGDSQVRNTIRNIPAFQTAGRFDLQNYRVALRNQGWNEAGFEEQVRQSLMTAQLEQALAASEFVTSEEVRQSVALENQTRRVRHFSLPADLQGISVSDAEIEQYFNDHLDDYQRPEQVKVEYLLLDLASISASVVVDDVRLRAYYDQHAVDLTRPEQRQARHILVQISGEGPTAEAAALDKIKEARERIAKGESFAEVAKAVSEDPGTRDQGGDLGFFGRGAMDPAFEKAVFALHTGQLSEPVRSTFGYHLIELMAVQDAQQPNFEKEKAKLAVDYRKAEAERLYYELGERMAELTYEAADSLQPAAKSLGLQVLESPWLGRSGGEYPFRDPKLVGAMFREDLIERGGNSELVEMKGKEAAAMVFRVVDHQPARPESLPDVRERVLESVKSAKAMAQVEQRANTMVKALEQGGSFDGLAAGFTINDPGFVARHDAKVPESILTSLFGTIMEEGDAKARFMVVSQSPQGVALVELSGVRAGQVDDAKLREAAQSRLRSGLASAYYRSLVADLRAQAKVDILVDLTKRAAE